MRREHDQMPPGTLSVYRSGDGALHLTGTSLAEGVMDYGNGRLQLITPEAVLSAGELDARAVITLGHPPEEVTPANVQQYQVGDAGSKTKIRLTKGGFSECLIDMAIRTEKAIALAVAGKITGLSRCHIPIIVEEVGDHPIFGHYTEKRIGHLGDTEHIALCGDSAELPPPRGPGCGVYLDSHRSAPMTPEERAKKAADAFAALATITDALSYDKAIAMLKELAADPEGLLLIKAFAEKGNKAEEPAKPEPAAPEAPPSMDAIAKAVAAAVAPLTQRLDAMDKRDADAATARNATADAEALSAIRTAAERHGLATAATADSAACLAHLRSKLGLAADASPETVLAVATFAAAQPVAPHIFGHVGDSVGIAAGGLL